MVDTESYVGSDSLEFFSTMAHFRVYSMATRKDFTFSEESSSYDVADVFSSVNNTFAFQQGGLAMEVVGHR